MLPSYAVAQEIASGDLHCIRQTERALTMRVRILVRNAEFIAPAVRAFITTAGENSKLTRKEKIAGA
ncbi:MAG: hypothetical protein JSS87_07485 [Acidobacteria bacterium]|nr:hypothetical protein [Acidobacteriota bacterium]